MNSSEARDWKGLGAIIGTVLVSVAGAVVDGRGGRSELLEQNKKLSDKVDEVRDGQVALKLQLDAHEKELVNDEQKLRDHEYWLNELFRGSQGKPMQNPNDSPAGKKKREEMNP